ncbi:hypothetical protein [Glycomyces terrestris]|uniref:DUF2569 family protein n=1 Tax=Glycomyces terrestris TaxID=2493553 RepID=A0A426USJ9_9ACTN|nr:hypothetical protein [Glycomyces terrestris]RRR96476.1 hypothetical protein EIW28_21805 [Glycomyces terrestris]
MPNPPYGPVLHRPNPLFYLLGLPFIAYGVWVAFQGVLMVVAFFDRADPFAGDGPAAFGEGATTVVWGAVTFTIGCYIWRAARRRGAKDRFGRLLIIAGYVLVGFGLEAAVDVMTAMIQGNDGRSAVLEAAVWAVPGAILGAIGMKMADEIAIMTATVNE